MDLSQLDVSKAAEDGAIMEVRHPVTGEVVRFDPAEGEKIGKPFTVTVAGYDSERWKRASRAQLDKRLAAGRRQKVTSSDLENDAIELLVAATIDWSIKVDGKTPKCEPKVVAEVYRRFPWLREQVDAFAADRGNFIKA